MSLLDDDEYKRSSLSGMDLQAVELHDSTPPRPLASNGSHHLHDDDADDDEDEDHDDDQPRAALKASPSSHTSQKGKHAKHTSGTGFSASNNNATSAAPTASSSSSSALNPSVNPTSSTSSLNSTGIVTMHAPHLSDDSRGHYHAQSLMGLTDVEVELSPTLKRHQGRSEEDIIESDRQQHDDDDDDDDGQHKINMPGKRSSMIGTYNQPAGGGGGEEELEHVMPSLDKLSGLKKILNHFAWNLAIFLVIAGDVVLIVFKVALAKDSPALQTITLVLMAFFLLEILARIIAFGREFFKNFRFVIYSLTTIGAFLFLVDAFSLVTTTRDIVAIILQCASAGLRFVAFFCELAPAARAMVSTNKARYQQHGFDLDLTYITSRLIAMGLPSTRMEAVYRNPIDEVAKFFNTMHKDHYLIINLCSERTYPTEKFHGRVVRFPFDDHNPCPLSTLLQFCVYVDDFLKQDKENVIAVHCKGGKGRTGTMCASWLLFSKPEMYAEQALKLFATYRTAQDLGGRLQGVSGPSQKRYIGYFEQLRFVTQNKQNILAESFSHLRNTPPMELVSLTLNHVAPVEIAREIHGGGGMVNERIRDVHNSQWNKSSNWSLLITYYAPIETYEGKKLSTSASSAGASSPNSTKEAKLPPVTPGLEDEVEDPEHWTADIINRRNQARYKDTKEFYFPAREKEMSADDDSVTFDISSFHSSAKSLILTGDLKFQVFRGNLGGDLHAAEREDSTTGSGGGGASDKRDKPFVYCWFWLNTSFANQSSHNFILRKEQIDEVARDSKVDPEMNLNLEYHCPPRPESWTHAPHPTFHLIPAHQPLSPKTPKSPTIEEDEDDDDHSKQPSPKQQTGGQHQATYSKGQPVAARADHENEDDEDEDVVLDHDDI